MTRSGSPWLALLACCAWLGVCSAHAACDYPRDVLGERFRAHVLQTMTTADGQTHHQKGQMWYAAPQHLKWTVTEGEPEQVWIHQGQLIWVDDGAEQVTVAPVSRLPQPWRTLLQTASQEIVSWHRDVAVSACTWRAELPQGGQLRLSSNGDHISIRMRGSNGDSVRLDIQIDSREPMARAVWQPHWPAHYRRVHWQEGV